MSALPPTRRMRLSWSARSSFTCTVQRQLAHLVEEERARTRPPRRGPAFASTAPVKLPFSWPKSSLSMSPSGMAPQLMATKGWSRRSLRGVDGAGHHLLAGPALAGDEHGGPGGRHLLDQLAHLRMAGESPRISSAPVRRAPTWWRSTRFSATQGPVLQRLLDHQPELLHLEGLQDVVVGPQLHGLDGVLGGGEGGHHHHLGAGATRAFTAAQHVESRSRARAAGR